MITAVKLPLDFHYQLRDEVLRAFPRECCGLIDGVIEGQTARVIALHATCNLAVDPDRFEIDPAAQFALLRRLRGSERAIIGCYHSHPSGRAEPSERDRESAVEPGFLWLIAAVDSETRLTRIAAFVSAGNSFSPAQIVDALGTRAPVARLDRAIPPAAGQRPALAELA